MPNEIVIHGASDAPRHAVHDADGRVVNVIVWNPESDYNPGSGLAAIELTADDVINPGDVIDPKTRTVITPTALTNQPPTTEEKLDAVLTLLVEASVVTEAKAEEVRTGEPTPPADGK